MYIGISKLTSIRTRNDIDSFIPITGINLTWTNQSGILSTLTQEDLYLLSVIKMDLSNPGLCSQVDPSYLMVNS
jgi:hypothetical protein